MKTLTIFSGETCTIKLTFSVDANNKLVFPNDVTHDEINERLAYQLSSSDYGCEDETINIFKKARTIYMQEK